MTIARGDSQVRVKRKRGSWVAAPLDIITHDALTSNAKVVLIYMLALSDREGWVIKVSHVKAKLKLGDAAWVAARNNLASAGYFKSTRVQVEMGKFVWLHEASDSPEFTNCDAAIPGLPIPGLPMDGSPIHGEPGDVVINSQAITKKQQHRARARPAPAFAGAAAAEPFEKGKEHKAFRIMSGVECWTHEDPAITAVLLEQHGVEAVQRVAQALRTAGVAPVPSRVGRELQQRAAAALKAAARTGADERSARLEAESRRRGDREMVELMALQALQTTQGRDQ